MARRIGEVETSESEKWGEDEEEKKGVWGW